MTQTGQDRSIRSRMIRLLRGDTNSVRQRFIRDPLERLSLAWCKAKGGTYLEWYAERINKNARLTARASRDSARWKRFADHYMARPDHDLNVLINFGMKPEHKLHEFGVGFGRSAQHFIRYLDKGNFSANDSSDGRIELGIAYLDERGLMKEKDPLILVNKDNTFDWMDDRKVDFIWAMSVFGHMPPEDIVETLVNMKRTIMHQDTVFFFTIANLDVDTVSSDIGSKYINAATEDQRSRGVKRESVKDWWHSLDWYRSIGKEHGFLFENVSDALPEEGFDPATAMIKLTLAEGALPDAAADV